MLLKTFLQNKNRYLAYNHFRKRMFSELTPKDSEAILYLLPWMLSVNHPAVPGYVSDLKKQIAVFDASTDTEIIRREPAFKKIFSIKKQGAILIPASNTALIQGIYTIGSCGTISQTSSSDCDVWLCIDDHDFDDQSKDHLYDKIHLIKDWMDLNLKMPVYFFICNIEDIRNSNFGALDCESSGSAQRNVLKEEFYRTSILISGKIPLWWVCFDPHDEVDYQELATQYHRGDFGDYDFIDMGPLDSVGSEEYFGSALWQFNKALTHPLKSIIKMLLLEMFLASSGEVILCNRFRNSVLVQEENYAFPDPSIFTLNAVLDFKERIDKETFEFIKKCCYLRYEIKLHSKKLTPKEELARGSFLIFSLTREQIYHLNDFADWTLFEHLDFGEKIFTLLVKIYEDISSHQKDTVSKLSPQDMTSIGKKLAACLARKPNKIPIIHKPLANLNLPTLIFSYEKNVWQVFAAGNPSKPVITHRDIVYCIAYLRWNDLYTAGDIRMTPNPTPVTLQEIANLSKKIRDVFGVFDITSTHFENFLEQEKVTKMLIAVNSAGSQHSKNICDFCIIYSNHWGELFVCRFNSQEEFKDFLQNEGQKFSQAEIVYYIQRNSLYYEKIIERTKILFSHFFTKASAETIQQTRPL